MSDVEELSKQAKRDIARCAQCYEQQVEAPRQQRNEQSYNGVLGRLPQWVPEWHQNQFEITRNNLLDNGVYGKPLSPHIVQGYIKIHTELGVTRDSTILNPGEETDGPQWIPPELLQDVGYLAHVQWCISLGEDQGLQELSGPMAARGAAYTRRTRKGGKKGAEARWRESNAPPIQAAARRWLAAGKQRRGLAAKLSERYSLSVRQINRILKKADI